MEIPASLAQEFGWSLALPWPVVVARILGSLVLGGLIGAAVNPRTHMLVALAAASYCIITLEMVAGAYNDSVVLDPIRIVEAVTSGVAFLAGGVIVFSKGEVRGLTTGAGLWLSASMGLAVGLGLWPLAVLATGLGLAVVRITTAFERRKAET